jgi:hypothetical protein
MSHKTNSRQLPDMDKEGLSNMRSLGFGVFPPSRVRLGEETRRYDS